MNMPRDADTNRLAKEIEERVQPRQSRVFSATPAVRQLKNGERAVVDNGTDVKEIIRVGNAIYETVALTKL